MILGLRAILGAQGYCLSVPQSLKLGRHQVPYPHDCLHFSSTLSDAFERLALLNDALENNASPTKSKHRSQGGVQVRPSALLNGSYAFLAQVQLD